MYKGIYIVCIDVYIYIYASVHRCVYTMINKSVWIYTQMHTVMYMYMNI